MTDGAAGGPCSRAGCRRPAAWRIDWRNPKLHDVTRHKTWLACDEHRAFLVEFLAARDFPLEVAALAKAEGWSS